MEIFRRKVFLFKLKGALPSNGIFYAANHEKNSGLRSPGKLHLKLDQIPPTEAST